MITSPLCVSELFFVVSVKLQAMIKTGKAHLGGHVLALLALLALDDLSSNSQHLSFSNGIHHHSLLRYYSGYSTVSLVDNELLVLNAMMTM